MSLFFATYSFRRPFSIVTPLLLQDEPHRVTENCIFLAHYEEKHYEILEPKDAREWQDAMHEVKNLRDSTHEEKSDLRESKDDISALIRKIYGRGRPWIVYSSILTEESVDDIWENWLEAGALASETRSPSQSVGSSLLSQKLEDSNMKTLPAEFFRPSNFGPPALFPPTNEGNKQSTVLAFCIYSF